jgi:hypothetical protein
MDAVHAERDEVARSLRRRLSIQRKADGAPAQAQIPEGGGEPLGAGVRKKLEPKLGAKLHDVRVHTGGESAQAATQLGARAFTVGSDVHFGAGQFAPGTKEGDRLLAHELTHVVQGQRSGIQRKETDGNGAGAADAGAHEGHEVSQPGEPAEKEADAVADKVTDDLHAPGTDKNQKDKKKKGGDGPGEKHEGDGAAAEHGHAAHGDAAAQAGHPIAEGADKAPAESPKPIAAKLEESGVHRSAMYGGSPLLVGGRKIFRKPKPPSPAPTPPGAGGSPAPGATPADPELKLPEIQQQLVTALTPANTYSAAEVQPLAQKWAPTGKLKKSEFDTKKAGGVEPELLQQWRAAKGTDENFVTEWCAPDSIASRNLSQVKSANADYFDGGDGALKGHKTGFYGALASKIMPGGLKRDSIFNAAFYAASVPYRFKGMKVTGQLPKMLSRCIDYDGFYNYNVDKKELAKQAVNYYNNTKGLNATVDQFSALPDADRLMQEYLKSIGSNSGAIRTLMKGTLHPKGGNWWTPNQLKVEPGQAGFAQLLTLFALEPQYFASGTVFFKVDTSALGSVIEARKPTCFDGMQSSMWVPREGGGETFGVTGGGIGEVMVNGIPVDRVTEFQCNFPAPDLSSAITSFEKEIRAKTGGSAMDALDRAGSSGPKRDNVVNQMKGVGPGGDALANLNQGINKRTTTERNSPTPSGQVAKNSTVQDPGSANPKTA